MNILSGADVLGTEKRLLTADEKDIAYETFIVVSVAFAAAVTYPPWLYVPAAIQYPREP